jgi:hypothetical protein
VANNIRELGFAVEWPKTRRLVRVIGLARLVFGLLVSCRNAGFRGAFVLGLDTTFPSR